ncbi:MAG: helix-turn-helix transcriptional regulator [Oscillospiraceae bacterium]|nr:helix-turn-helix transcriptional regulator [Oscillospiraceae bacterium]
MEFSEKLQELRKRRGMTQEELAEALYVSRTAVSKWESGRGYPSIDSLKQISAFFSVSIDDLLSGEKLISIAEQENRSNIRYVCDMLFGMTDLLSFLAVVLPLYPKAVNGFVYSVNLFDYTALTQLSRLVYWLLLSALVLTGALKVFLTLRQNERGQKTVTGCSVVLGILSVIVLSLAGETYAVTLVFLLLLIKVGLLYRCIKSD